MIFVPDTSYRIPAILVTVLALASIIGVNIGRGKQLLPILRRCVSSICLLVLLFSVFFIVVPSRSALDQFCWNVHSQWLRIVEPNILNRHIILNERNPDISLPIDPKGIVVNQGGATDLHVELDSRGWISISNVHFSKHALMSVLSARVKRIGEFRVFVWADAKTPHESLAELVRILNNEGCAPLYLVVSSPEAPEGKADYRGIPWDEYTSNENDE